MKIVKREPRTQGTATELKTATQVKQSLTVLLFAALSILALSSCSYPRPLKGGKALTAHGQIQQSLAQGENPAQPSRQDQESITIRSYTLPAGSRIEQRPLSNSGLRQQSNAATACVTLVAPMPVVEREEVRANTQLGASQKDTARELGAKLSSLRSITWVGVGLFIFGLGSLVWPPLKAVIGSVTTSVVLMLGGVALVILPTLIVGNELLILGAVCLCAGAWFLAHRHGQLRGLVATQTSATATATASTETVRKAPRSATHDLSI